MTQIPDLQAFRQQLRRSIDGASFARGLSYFRGQHVVKLNLEEASSSGILVRGKVRGSSYQPYDVALIVDAAANQLKTNACSCPIGGNCKHVVAVGLSAIEAWEKVPGRSTGSDADWRRPLETLLAKRAQVPELPFVLQLRLKRPANRYQAAVSVPWQLEAKPRFDDPAKLAMVDTPYGTRYQVHLSWEAFTQMMASSYGMYGSTTIDLMPYLKATHRAVAQQLALLFLDGTYGFVSGGAWKPIRPERARAFWSVLGQAVTAGIRIEGEKGELIPVSDQPITIGIRFDDVNHSIQSSPRMQLAGAELAPDEVIIIQPTDPDFALRVQARQSPAAKKLTHFAIHPAKGSLPMELRRSFRVPRQAVPEFAQQYLPKLMQVVPIDNRSATLVVPRTTTPRLHVEVVRTGTLGIVAKPTLRYHDSIVNPLLGQSTLTTTDNAYLRQPAEELAAMERLSTVVGDGLDLSTEGFEFEGIAAAQFIDRLTVLSQRDPAMSIEQAADLPQFTLDDRPPEIAFGIRDTPASSDWFNLDITVTLGGEAVPFHELFAALHANQSHLMLTSGRYFSLETPTLTQLRTLIAEAQTLVDQEGDGLQLSRYHANYWDELQRLGVVTAQSTAWQAAMAGLLDAAGVPPVPLPDKLAATLRPYQYDGFAWLHFLYSHGLGGVLADDMGLGKTVQMIALICAAAPKSTQPFLVIAPTSVVENWDTELERFAPHLKRIVLRAGDRSAALKRLSKADVVMTSYALLLRDFDQLKAVPFAAIIMDEAQFIKNHQAKAYGLIRQLTARSRFALTGTPMENNLTELWAILSAAAPGLLPPPKQFTETYARPIEKQHDTEQLAKLRRRIRPFLLRRGKALVANELPPKSEQVLAIELTGVQQQRYARQLQRERSRVLGLLATSGLAKNRFVIFQSLMKLRQLCLHAGLVDAADLKHESAKLTALLELLPQLLTEGHRVIVFSQFTSFLALVRQQLDAQHLDYLYLDGATKQRGPLISQFQREEGANIFLISLKAGGTGLNLTGADYCILLDPWWNPAVEQQAIDRTHRLGQTKPVMVYRFIAKETIEEKVVALQGKKRQLFRSVLEAGDQFAPAVTEADIRDMFQA